MKVRYALSVRSILLTLDILRLLTSGNATNYISRLDAARSRASSQFITGRPFLVLLSFLLFIPLGLLIAGRPIISSIYLRTSPFLLRFLGFVDEQCRNL